MALSLAKPPYARQEAPLCLPQQWESILPLTPAVGTLSSSGRTESAASLCCLPSPWAAPLPPPHCQGLLSLGSGCLALLMPVGAASSLSFSAHFSILQPCPGVCRQGEASRCKQVKGVARLSAQGDAFSVLSLQNSSAFSLSPLPHFCPCLSPPASSLSPAAMNPLLKSCLTHQDLPTSPRCLARRPAWLIPCSRNCPVPADAGSRALVPCNHCHWGPLSVALAR